MLKRSIAYAGILSVSIGLMLGLNRLMPSDLYMESGGEAIIGLVLLLSSFYLKDGWLLLPAPPLIASGGIDSYTSLFFLSDLWYLKWPLVFVAFGMGLFMSAVINAEAERHIRLSLRWTAYTLVVFCCVGFTSLVSSWEIF